MGLSQEELTEQLRLAGWRIGQSTLANIESGKRSLLDYEWQLFLDVFGKSWKDVVPTNVEPIYCPKPQSKKRNSSGALIERFRKELGWTREELMRAIQRAGWDIDRAVLVSIEKQERPLLDYELKLIFAVLGQDWDSIFRKRDTQKRTPHKKKM